MATRNSRVYGDAGLGTVSGVVSSLPVGYTLGEERVVDSNSYRLVYNAGGEQISLGYVASPAAGSVGPYSVTVTTLSDSAHHIGAVTVQHATATTDTYFWGMYNGRVPKGMQNANELATGAIAMISADGEIATGPSLPTEMVGNKQALINMGGTATGGTGLTDSISGDFYISFD